MSKVTPICQQSREIGLFPLAAAYILPSLPNPNNKMGLRDWFHSSGDEEYSSQTDTSKFPSPDTDSEPHFQGSFSSSVTRCEPDETGQTRCRRYITRRTRNSPTQPWSEERTDEELPYEEAAFQVPGVNEMMEDVNRMMEEFGSAFGRFSLFPGWGEAQNRPVQEQRQHREPTFPFAREQSWRPKPAPQRGYGDSDEVFDA